MTRIRRVMPADWQVFQALRIEMLSIEPPVFGTPAPVWAAKPEKDVRQWLTDLHAIGLFDSDRLLGSAAFARDTGPRTSHRATVISVYLRPEARGQGHMSAMLGALAEAARTDGIVQLELQVVSENGAAIAAYERAGFRRIGTMPRSLRTETGYVDEELMILPLDT